MIRIEFLRSRVKTVVLAALTAGSCLMAVVLLNRYRLEVQLLRADPASIPTLPKLMTFARGRGEAVYSSHCATCHGAVGQGDSARGIPNLRDDDWLYGTGSISDIEQVITYGIRSYNPRAWNLAIMPAYATARPSAGDDKIPPLSPANIRDLVEFLLHQQGRDPERGRVSAQGRESAQDPDSAQGRDTETAAIARGAALFSGAAGCYDCHAPDAKGDPGIGAPNLVDAVTLYGDGSREALTLSISNGRAGVCPAWIKRIGPAGIREVAAYVYALSRGAPGCRGPSC